jgi:prepilin signal peptidase PulO-like enzyme (type II secretory pathway)
MEWIDSIAMPWRYLFLALAGLIGGAFVNHIAYSWAFFPRPISPWGKPPASFPSRRVVDRIPVLGWFGRRQEATLHGRGFWIRPIFIEIVLAFGIPVMYWYYTQSGGLLPSEFRGPRQLVGFSPWAHALFAIHACLGVLMVSATLIDFDEQTIPDSITIPGTLIALFFSALPWRSFLPAKVRWGEVIGVAPTTFNVPWIYDESWGGWGGFLLGLTIWWVWIFALTDRHWVTRRGWRWAVRYLVYGVSRNPASKGLLLLGLAGAGGIVGVWLLGGPQWCGLLSSLIGVAVGGGTVWAVRVIAGYAMGQEAMGFGDVTLMAMIGAFLGWQAALAAFFLAPLAALLIVVIQYIATREPAVPFGPYLCFGAVLAVVGWDKVWNQSLSMYVELGVVLVAVLLGALFAMGAMLFVWGQIKKAIFAE